MLKVVIIDDEPLAVEVLQNHLQKIPNMQVVGTCKNAVEAFAFVTKNEVDLMLLDINMPEISGVEFLSSLKEPPMVIFTTAYSEYALKSYELNAIDYLLKPISFERLSKAISKAFSNKLLKTQQATDTINTLLFLRSEGKWIKIDVNRIWFVEGLKDYVRVWTDEGRITVHSTMKNFEEQLNPYKHFVRAHKSYIVNVKLIKETNGNSIIIQNETISVGGTYKDELIKKINDYLLH